MFNLFVVILITLISNLTYANRDALESFGDIAQIAAPLIATTVASQEKGMGHFAGVFGQSMAVMGASKMIGKTLELEISQRPYRPNNRTRFDGFPSGHTTSAWTAAAYLRTYSKNYQSLVIPMYGAAILTAYSRVHAKQHTTTQVLTAIALSETTVWINHRLNWSETYQGRIIALGPKQLGVGLSVRF